MTENQNETLSEQSGRRSDQIPVHRKLETLEWSQLSSKNSSEAGKKIGGQTLASLAAALVFQSLP